MTIMNSTAPNTMTKMFANPEISNVRAAYLAVTSAIPTRQYFSCKIQPCNLFGMVKSHFKGISSYKSKLIFSHTNLGLIVNPPHGMLIPADHFPYSKENATVGEFHTSESHPCASQVCGDYMALGQQQTAESRNSEIQIYDVSPVESNLPPTLLGSIRRLNDGVNGVAMTKESESNGGRYIVAGVNGNNLTIYRSDSTSLEPVFPTFTPIPIEGNFSASGAGLALITQTDGTIFIISMNADDDGGNSQMDLFQLDLQSRPPTCKSILSSPTSMPIPGMSECVDSLDTPRMAIKDPALYGFVKAAGPSILNSSFRWGKGIAVTPDGNLVVYASDRNALPDADSPDDPSKNKFSLVVWTVEEGLAVKWTGAMSQGSGADTWLIGDFNGDGKDEIVQGWGNDLNFIMYGSNFAGGLTTLWQGDMGQGSGAATWLVGDFNGDGKDEIVQGWGNDLNFIMYGSDGAGGLTTLWQGEMGQGSGAATWLVGDFNGDGKDEIVQGWGHDLKFTMYGSNGAGGLTTLWQGDMGQGSGALSWFVGDFNGDGKLEIVQVWGSTSINFIMYGSDGAGGLKPLWTSSPDGLETPWTDKTGNGWSPYNLLVGDFNGDGMTEIVVGIGIRSELHFVMYGSDGAGGLKILWWGDVGQGSGANTWLVGDFKGDGHSQIAQGWGHDLNFIMYGTDGAGGLITRWTGDMGQGSGAVTWLVADINGTGAQQIIQGWGHDLNMIVYGKP